MIKYDHCPCSLVFVEADDVGIFTEASSADVHSVFADESLSGSADSAFSTAFAVSTGVCSPEKVGHCFVDNLITNIIYYFREYFSM